VSISSCSPSAGLDRAGQETGFHRLAHALAEFLPDQVLAPAQAPVGAGDVEDEQDADRGAGQLAGAVSADALEAEAAGRDEGTAVRVALAADGSWAGLSIARRYDRAPWNQGGGSVPRR
jgi:hypothetical protein